MNIKLPVLLEQLGEIYASHISKKRRNTDNISAYTTKEWTKKFATQFENHAPRYMFTKKEEDERNYLVTTSYSYSKYWTLPQTFFAKSAFVFDN